MTCNNIFPFPSPNQSMLRHFRNRLKMFVFFHIAQRGGNSLQLKTFHYFKTYFEICRLRLYLVYVNSWSYHYLLYISAIAGTGGRIFAEVVSPYSTRLNIMQLSVQDSGSYQCVTGTHRTTFTIQVFGKTFSFIKFC